MTSDLDTLITRSDPLWGHDVPNGDSHQAEVVYQRVLGNLSTGSPRRVKPRRIGFSVAGVAFVSLVLAAGLILTQTAPPVSAEAALTNVAALAAEQPVADLATGQWLHSIRRGVVQLGFTSTNGVPSPGAEATVAVSLESWVGSDGAVAYRERFGDPQFTSAAAESAWSSAGLP